MPDLMRLLFNPLWLFHVLNVVFNIDRICLVPCIELFIVDAVFVDRAKKRTS
jgi:hypothetical protein